MEEKHTADDYTVAWVSALPIEMAAAKGMLDQVHPNLYEQTAADHNTYLLGQIQGHNVVIACLPAGVYGTISAATVAKDLVRTFKSVRFALMVGIGGAAPSTRHDIRLGDVVVSQPTGTTGGVIQYDRGKTGPEERFERTGSLNMPPQTLLTALARLQTEHITGDSAIPEILKGAIAKYPKMKAFTYRGESSDCLFRAEYEHASADSGCEHCDRAYAIHRDAREDTCPVAHYGNIASGNQVVKSATLRDRLSKDLGVLCFEMEAAGLMQDFPCLVIRGICDYSDTHKNKEWQGYAAMVAAAYAKELLQQVSPSNVKAERRIVDTLGKIEQKIDGVYQAQQAMKAVNDGIRSDQHVGKLHRWLSPPDPSTNANSARKLRHEGTGAWLLESRAFREWRSGSRRHLWLHGLSGCGKTVLSATVLDHLQASEHIVLNFFFDFNDAAKQTTDGMLRSLAYQLCRRNAQSDAHLQSLFQSCQDGRNQPTTSALLGVVRKMLGNYKSVYVVLDVLDESTTRPELLRCLEDIISMPDLTHIQLLCTGRPEVEFVKDIPALIGEDSCVQLDRDAINTDIDTYVAERLDRSPRFTRWARYPKVLEQIRTTIGSKSDGMFRWAACQLDSLEQCLDREEIETALASLPQDLNETYARMLARIPSGRKQKAIRLLQFLAYSDQPLTPEEAVDVIAVRIDDHRREFNAEDRMPEPSEIIGFCPSLVSLVHVEKSFLGSSHIIQELHLSHFSVKEYLHISPICGFVGAEPSTSITLTCLTYLSCISEVEDATASQFPLAKYGARVWMDHARPAEESDRIVDLALEFLQSEKTFVTWTTLHQPDVPWRDEPDENQASCLYFACLKGLIRVAQKLIMLGNDVNAQGGLYGNALQAASHGGHTGIVQLLLDKNADVNAQGGLYGNALQAASYRGHTGIVKLLLDKNADVNAQGGEYGNALQAASYEGHTDTVQLLLDKNADVNAQGGEYGNALQAASYRGHTGIVQLLLANNADVNTQGGEYSNALYAASSGGHTDIVELLQANNADVNAQGGEYGNALQAASYGGHTGIVQLLLDKNADVNAQGGRYGNALQAASYRGHTEIVERLLAKNADVNAQGGFYGNALQAASYEGHTGIVKLLLANNADVMMVDATGYTPINSAAISGHSEVVKLLIRAAAVSDVASRDGWTPINNAVVNGHVEVVKVLVEAGVDITIASNSGWTPLLVASKKGHDIIVRILLESHKASPNSSCKGGRTALSRAAQNGHAAVIRVLLETKDINVNSRDETGRTPLMWATQAVEAAGLRLLCDGGADVDAEDSCGLTALQLAVIHSNSAAEQVLMRYGASASRDLYGFEALFSNSV